MCCGKDCEKLGKEDMISTLFRSDAPEDTNINNAWHNASDDKEGHNICSEEHNSASAECPVTGLGELSKTFL